MQVLWGFYQPNMRFVSWVWTQIQFIWRRALTYSAYYRISLLHFSKWIWSFKMATNQDWSYSLPCSLHAHMHCRGCVVNGNSVDVPVIHVPKKNPPKTRHGLKWNTSRYIHKPLTPTQAVCFLFLLLLNTFILPVWCSAVLLISRWLLISLQWSCFLLHTNTQIQHSTVSSSRFLSHWRWSLLSLIVTVTHSSFNLLNLFKSGLILHYQIKPYFQLSISRIQHLFWVLLVMLFNLRGAVNSVLACMHEYKNCVLPPFVPDWIIIGHLWP